MDILLLTADLPYPSESGAAIRNIGIIRGLSQAGHRLTLLSFAERPPARDANPLFQLCENVHAVPIPHHGKIKRVVKLFMSDQADMAFRLASEQFEQTLTAILKEKAFDLIQFSGIELGCYLPLLQRGKKNAKVVYDALNAEAELQSVAAHIDRQRLRRFPAALYSTLQSTRLARYERAICRDVNAIIAVSEDDRDFLIKHGGAPVFVMPNGIAVPEYEPPADAVREPCQLVFSGKMDYRPNVDAVEWFHSAVFPLLRVQFPETRLLIVGRNPHRRLKALAAEENVQVTGWVESVLPYLHQATIYVAPLRMGSGTRLKILQAMAAGCAVISTTIGAAGLNPALQSALTIADDAAGIRPGDRLTVGRRAPPPRTRGAGAGAGERALRLVGAYSAAIARLCGDQPWIERGSLAAINAWLRYCISRRGSISCATVSSR